MRTNTLVKLPLLDLSRYPASCSTCAHNNHSRWNLHASCGTVPCMIVLCTGCRSGFGLRIAATAARQGHIVYAGVRDVERCPELLEASRGTQVIPVTLDVSNASQREAVIQRIVAEQGRLDALVNNAGIALGGFQEQISTEEFKQQLDVNVVAVHALTRLALPLLRDAHGIVINISSMASRQALPGLGAYAATKFAMEGMTEALRHEMRPFGVRVCSVQPGPYKTDIFERNRWLAEATKQESVYSSMQKRIETAVQEMEKNMGNPQDVADVVVELLTHPRPRLRYPMGPGVRLRLAALSLLPFEWMEHIIARRLGF